MNAPQTKIEATSDRSLDSISAVVGIGHSDWRADYAAVRGGGKPTDSYGYGAVSLKRALADTGIDKSEVDLFCVYCPETDECYYLAPQDFRSHVSLRVSTPRNGQRSGVNMAADYRRVP